MLTGEQRDKWADERLLRDLLRRRAETPYSAWENYRPDDLTDDELAALDELSEEVIKSKGAIII